MGESGVLAGGMLEEQHGCAAADRDTCIVTPESEGDNRPPRGVVAFSR